MRKKVEADENRENLNPKFEPPREDIALCEIPVNKRLI
jgi:hypothetical protein